jgi:hypothetical protein
MALSTICETSKSLGGSFSAYLSKKRKGVVKNEKEFLKK